MKKLAIIGGGPSNVEAPFNSDEWEFWGLNNLYQYVPKGKSKWTTWFDLHKFTTTNGQLLRKGEVKFRGTLIQKYLDILQSMNIPVYMQPRYQMIPNAKPFPYETLIEKFGRYFTGSHAWMLAFAIHLGYKTVGLFGSDMSDPIHRDKRACLEYIIGFAKGCGIEVVIPQSSPILKCNHLYGFES